MWPFKSKPKPIWKLVASEFIRQASDTSDCDITFYHVFADTYVNMLDESQTKIQERYELS